MTSMTPDELRAIGEALFGPRWQTPLAHHLGMRDAAEIRKWASGRRPVPDHTADRLRDLVSHDTWIVGVGSETDADYIIHTRYPRFVAKIAATDDPDANTVDGLTYSLPSGGVLCEFIWSAPIPAEQALLDLLREAAEAIDRIDYR